MLNEEQKNKMITVLMVLIVTLLMSAILMGIMRLHQLHEQERQWKNKTPQKLEYRYEPIF
jgi:flagellar basal body-associated protein FliL